MAPLIYSVIGLDIGLIIGLVTGFYISQKLTQKTISPSPAVSIPASKTVTTGPSKHNKVIYLTPDHDGAIAKSIKEDNLG